MRRHVGGALRNGQGPTRIDHIIEEQDRFAETAPGVHLENTVEVVGLLEAVFHFFLRPGDSRFPDARDEWNLEAASDPFDKVRKEQRMIEGRNGRNPLRYRRWSPTIQHTHDRFDQFVRKVVVVILAAAHEFAPSGVAPGRQGRPSATARSSEMAPPKPYLGNAWLGQRVRGSILWGRRCRNRVALWTNFGGQTTGRDRVPGNCDSGRTASRKGVECGCLEEHEAVTAVRSTQSFAPVQNDGAP